MVKLSKQSEHLFWGEGLVWATSLPGRLHWDPWSSTWHGVCVQKWQTGLALGKVVKNNNEHTALWGLLCAGRHQVGHTSYLQLLPSPTEQFKAPPTQMKNRDLRGRQLELYQENQRGGMARRLNTE